MHMQAFDSPSALIIPLPSECFHNLIGQHDTFQQTFYYSCLCNVLRKEIWYHRPDMFSFRDMIIFNARKRQIEAMDIYEETRQSPADPPISLPFHVILKGMIPFPELRDQVKDDFLKLFPGMIVYNLAEDLFENQDSEDD
ncbi:PREDICTED: pentatricopeptide repeat-containing protein At1g62350-like [Populus euphratica]|uniref:Pentatricopeptide repeat-containing protein At1g62350-like n=1 Tax=Populus euphratica TaxID=75702 RepID=A0AAJ6TP51_POPEU|nr:PREDICTED: pentatricopeptide repeat-containing protein At1g62350-like [Populus euphratica]